MWMSKSDLLLVRMTSFITGSRSCAAGLTGQSLREMVGLAGLEPATPRLSSACSNQLSYRPVIGIYSVGFQNPQPVVF